VAKASSGGQLRIVGGRWRSRRLPVPDAPGLRPTTDRARETLFNWLAPLIEGSRCLDCFAGSGALGLEAASRGAAEVLLLERSRAVCRQLEANVAALDTDAVRVVSADALAWLRTGPPRAFDIVFIDPPFAAGLLGPACDLLARRGWVGDGSRVYLEAAAQEGFPPLPARWDLTREKLAGGVRYGLAEVGA
jgi:16S rRNA (guanine966-N2)-methyltransferase